MLYISPPLGWTGGRVEILSKGGSCRRETTSEIPRGVLESFFFFLKKKNAKQYICDQWKPKQVNMKIAKVSIELSYDCRGTQPSEQARAMSVASLIG